MLAILLASLFISLLLLELLCQIFNTQNLKAFLTHHSGNPRRAVILLEDLLSGKIFTERQRLEDLRNSVLAAKHALHLKQEEIQGERHVIIDESQREFQAQTKSEYLGERN